MTKLKMTHNEYWKYSRKNFNKLHNMNEPDYGLEQFWEDSEKVEIIPYDLSEYNLPKEIEKAINDIFVEEATSNNGEYTLRGFSENEDDWCKKTDRLGLKRPMNYRYAGYCYSENLNMYMTYCEDDIRLKLFKNKEDYDMSLKATIDWYDGYY